MRVSQGNKQTRHDGKVMTGWIQRYSIQKQMYCAKQYLQKSIKLGTCVIAE